MTELISELRARRLVRELDPLRRAGAGRPTRPIALDGEPWVALGVALEPHRLRFVATTVGGRELWRDTVSATLGDPGSTAPREHLVQALRDQLEKLPPEQRLAAVEVAVPGTVSRDRGTVSGSYTLGWDDVPLRRWIEEALAQTRHEGAAVGAANGAQLAALHAVRVELDLPPRCDAVYVGGRRRLSGGLLVQGEIFRGAHGEAGDFAHVHADPNGPTCWCGRVGCLEAMIGPRRLLVAAGLRDAPDDVETDRGELDEEPYVVVELLASSAAAGDRQTLEVLAHAGAVLGNAIDDLIGLLSPHAVVLGGYLGVLSPYLMPTLVDRLATRTAGSATMPVVVALPEMQHRAVAGAVLAARDACLYDPLTLTEDLSA